MGSIWDAQSLFGRLHVGSLDTICLRHGSLGYWSHTQLSLTSAGSLWGIWQLVHGWGTVTSVSMGLARSHEATLGGLADLPGKGGPWEGETTDMEGQG